MGKETELHGWKSIADHLQKSVPTAMSLAREQRAPITLLGKTPYTTAEKLEKWMDSLIEKEPYWRHKGLKT